jgi:hypothetical protein
MRLNQFEYGEDAQPVWEALERLNRDLYVKHGELLTTWKPVPRRAAFWLSHCDLAHSGIERYDFAYADEKADDLFRALLDAGEPFDIIYDDEVLAGRLAQYRLLVIPPIKTATVSMVEALMAFIANDGTVVAPEGFDLPVARGVKTVAVPNGTDKADRETNYPTWREEITRTEYRDWLHSVAEAMMDAAGLTPRVRLDRRDVIANLMEAGGRKYLVLVNDNREFGPWAEKYGETSLDKGVTTRVTVAMDGVKKVVDVDAGTAVPVTNGRFSLTLEPGWGRIVELR